MGNQRANDGREASTNTTVKIDFNESKFLTGLWQVTLWSVMCRFLEIPTKKTKV